MKRNLLIAFLFCVFNPTLFASIVYSPARSNGYVQENYSKNAFTNLASASLFDFNLYAHSMSWREQGLAVIEFPIDTYSQTNVQNATFNFYFHNSAYLGREYGFYVNVLTGRSGDGVVSVDDHGNTRILSVPDGVDYDNQWFEVDVKDVLQDAVDQSYDWIMFSIHINSGTMKDSDSWCFSKAKIALSEDVTGKAPYLSIEVPEPATFGFLLLGAMSLFRKNKRNLG